MHASAWSALTEGRVSLHSATQGVFAAGHSHPTPTLLSRSVLPLNGRPCAIRAHFVTDLAAHRALVAAPRAPVRQPAGRCSPQALQPAGRPAGSPQGALRDKHLSSLDHALDLDDQAQTSVIPCQSRR